MVDGIFRLGSEIESALPVAHIIAAIASIGEIPLLVEDINHICRIAINLNSSV